jgi:hypothetical protein
MAKVTMYAPSLINGTAAHHPKTQAAVLKRAEKIKAAAEGNLSRARATTSHRDDVTDSGTHRFGDHTITMERGTNQYGEVDWLVSLEGPGAMAIEFGHYPSGVFDPAVYGSVTRAPHGLYIMTSAAGFGGLTSISSGRRRGKI